MTKKRVFYSFHYELDYWRTMQIRQMGTVEGNKPVTSNDWETVRRRGEYAIQKWIDEQLKYRSCTIVLIGEETAKRKWVQYEIKKSIDTRKGIFGIHIHNLKDEYSRQSRKGNNPFSDCSSDIRCYDPPSSNSQDVYNHIRNKLENWVEKAIEQAD